MNITCYNRITMATGATATYSISYPLLTDPVNIHGDIKTLADQLDLLLQGRASLGLSNIFTQSNVFNVGSSTDAVRISQTGTGNSLLVEDSANPDSTPFVIDASGNVGIGKTSPTKPLDVVGAGAFSGALTASTFNALSLTSNTTGFTVSGGTTSVATTFAGGSAYTISGTNGTTITLPSTTGTLPLNNQTFYIGTQAIAINAGTGTITTLPGVSSVNGTTIPSASTLLTSGGALGTPASGTLTNATGLPISTGVSGLGTGIATFLTTPSSSNLATAITDETGSGSLVFGTSPAITTSMTTPSTSFDLINTTATTINFGGAVTTFAMGGTPTTAITANIFTNATATATTKAINLGTGGASGSTTNITLGSSTSGALGTTKLNTGLSLATPPAIITATTYSATINDTVLIFNTTAACTLTLPSAVTYPGKTIMMKQIAAFAVTSASSNVTPLTSTTAGTAILSGAGKFAYLVSNGTNWVVMMSN